MQKIEKYWISTDNGIAHENLEVLNEFLLNLKLSNKSEATVRKYKSILQMFLKAIEKSVPDLTSNDVYEWLKEYSIGKKEKSIDLVLATLSKFFQFCIEEDYLDQMVFKKRWRPKIPKSLPKYLTEQEYAKVKRVAESLPLRDRAIVLFLFSTGCRRSELIGLKIADLDMQKRTVKVVGKGKKIRLVHISVECAIVIQDYLRTRKYISTDPLFLNRWGEPLGKTGIYKMIRKLGEKAELPYTLHPHCCRHTFATNMLAKGADIKFIAEEMGHNDVNTTLVYAKIPTEDLLLTYQNIMG